MSIISKQIDNLLEQAKSAWELLNLDESQNKVYELEIQMTEPDFWNDQEKARRISQEVSERKNQIEEWQFLINEIQDSIEMLQLAEKETNVEVQNEVEKTMDELEKNYRKMELQTLLSEELDTNSAIISIHAGAGGTDAMDWAGMLLRMYSRFAESRDWKIEVIDESVGEETGIKSATLAVNGRFAYGYLKAEAGVHRLVRISPFDAEKMRHTSFALVEVLPELDELSEKQFEINEKDLRIDTFMSSGKGGQSVNTTYSAVRITHIPTNTVVTCQNERSQLQNRDTALKVLKSRLYKRMLEDRAEELDELKGGHKSPEWGNQIRSYVLHPYQMVKDHRTNIETQDVQRVLNGDLEDFMEAYLKSQVSKVE